MRLALFEHREGVGPAPGNRIVYSVERGEAEFGRVGADGHALVWELGENPDAGAKLSADRQP